MKKYLLGLTLASVALSSYAVTTDIYEKPDTESTKIGTLNTDENTYNRIFSKGVVCRALHFFGFNNLLLRFEQSFLI